MDKWGISRSFCDHSANNKVNISIHSDPDFVPEYTEKVWGKDVNGEYITDGYTLKGNRSFNKSIVGLKSTLKKGVEYDIGKIKFKALDARENGAGFEIIIEVIENSNRGLAVLKLFGPHVGKKLSVITITKSKGSSHEFVILLAEKIVKPLIEKFSKSEISVDSALHEKKIIEKHNCPHCDKIFTTSPGLKGHITKIHKAKKVGLRTKHQNGRSISHSIGLKNQSSDDEVSKVIESLLTDVVEDGKNDGFLIDPNVTLSENTDYGPDKEYIDGCDQCDFRITASKKYIALQLVKKHKAEYHSKPCSQCYFKANSLQEMKRHMRDIHDVKTESTSPPNKKKRKQNQEEEVDMDSNDESIKDLSFKLEDMEIDSTNDEIEERSKKMDEKIAANVKRIEEEEKLQKEKAKEKEMKRKRKKE